MGCRFPRQDLSTRGDEAALRILGVDPCFDRMTGEPDFRLLER